MKFFSCLFMITILFVISANSDTIYLKNGLKQTEVTITKETCQYVYYKVKNSIKTKIDSYLIKQIEYSDAPVAFIDAQNAVLQKEYKNAIKWINESLKIAKKSKVIRNWIYHYAWFYKAQSYYGLARNSDDENLYKKAISGYNETTKIAPGSRFVFDCLFQKSKCYLHLKNFKKATKNTKELLNLLKNMQKQYYWQYKAVMLSGDILFLQKKYSQALKQYQKAQKILKNKQKLQYLLNDVTIAIGKCYIFQNEFYKAKRFFNSFRKKSIHNKNNKSLAAAKNGLALCYLKQEKYHKALQESIEVVIKFPQTSKQHALALFFSSQCYKKLNNQNNAKIYYNLLKLAYPGIFADIDWLEKLYQTQ